MQKCFDCYLSYLVPIVTEKLSSLESEFSCGIKSSKSELYHKFLLTPKEITQEELVVLLHSSTLEISSLLKNFYISKK
jgi:hypothetical protein